ncbi:hypothetical protein KRX51_02225 [Corynebacterium sp. TAE3-ERU12]|uniref:AMIN-like domain-containing (lipo)protein n=1 Tax=Corynebacterium sp. TAE3-ERU12 TaxID=2849491 RepID=UPI001C43D0D1|nr:hypothetical protein [Corynebacterium sp. TAE3-ERU12]MBV7294736.1 hypothetical protein [Corynebacterium sp. TAE3-ERU12]
MTQQTSWTHMMRLITAVPLVACVAFTAACADNEPAQPEQGEQAVSMRDVDPSTETETETVTETTTNTGTSTSTESTTSTKTQTTTVTLDPDEPKDKEFSRSPSNQRPLTTGLGITDVRVGAHEDYDRVVFEFDGADGAGWDVRYTDTPAQDGSGMPIAHPGDQALMVHLSGTGYPFELGIQDLTAGTLTPTTTDAVVEVSGHNIFEGRTQYLISIKGSKRPFRVFHLKDPQRIVIDIKHD